MQTKVIKEKIKSVGSIKKITKTMEMISATKMKKAVDSTMTIRPFHMEAQHILHDISLEPHTRHPLLNDNGVEKELVILISSNKGLCGSYNVNIYRKLVAMYSEEQRKNLQIIAIGKYSEKIARKLNLEVLASFNASQVTGDDAHATSSLIVKWYIEKKIGKVSIIYTHFVSGSTFTPTKIQLLPFSSEGEPDRIGEPRYAYEPDQDTVLSAIIPMMLHNIIYGGILESYASEHTARMIAMKNATDNAKELQDDLKLFYNRARQSAVTQEIAEISSGAMALTQ